MSEVQGGSQVNGTNTQGIKRLSPDWVSEECLEKREGIDVCKLRVDLGSVACRHKESRIWKTW